ncbi:MAG: hypothetical protein PVJ86_00080 [Phycisphaerales bacterium]|jgi:hypothetical protein
MSCNDKYADAGDFAAFFCVEVDNNQQEATINNYLMIAATDIHAARAQSGGCDCTLANWAGEYLKFLNIIIAASFYSCPCGRPGTSLMSDDTRHSYREWAQGQIDAIRDVRIELCAGETGSETPVLGWAEQGTTEFAKARIVLNDILRNS